MCCRSIYQHVEVRLKDLQFEMLCFRARFLNLSTSHCRLDNSLLWRTVLGIGGYLAVSLVSTH